MTTPTKTQRKSVLWVGLSEKPVKKGEIFVPLSANTVSGKLIAEVEARCPAVQFHRTNLVKKAPLNAQGKLRYPTNAECLEHYPRLEAEIGSISPSAVLLLGKQVATQVLNQVSFTVVADAFSFNYQIIQCGGVCYAAIHHPSYISVYKRKEKEAYIRAIQNLVEKCSF